MRKIRKCWEDKKLQCLYKGESYLTRQINGWKILGYHSTKEKPSGSRVDWLCECTMCEEQKQIPMYNIISGKSKMCANCANKNKNGYKNSNWKGFGSVPSSTISHIKNNAISRNLTFEIDGNYLNNLWESQNYRCALTGLELILKAKSKKDIPWSNIASLDRKDSNTGYVVGNVRWVHPIINIMKNQFTDDIFISMCNQVSIFACSANSCEVVDLVS